MSQPVGTNSTHSRQIAQVSPKLDKSLAAYVVAAGAAGVSILAAQSAEAEIVYTPVHITIAPRTTLSLDLNNDGVDDFVLSHWFYGHADHVSIIPEAPGNEVFAFAAALPAGVRIGPRGVFVNGALLAQQSSRSGISSFYRGPWKDAHHRYLGLKFSVNGEMHYGWARMTVTAKGGIVATLTGYAYETVPNKSIISGNTSGPADAGPVNPEEMVAPSPRPATLAMLARGADTLAIWRRDQETAVR